MSSVGADIGNPAATPESSDYDFARKARVGPGGVVMKIGAMAAAAQTPVETIRYYER